MARPLRLEFAGALYHVPARRDCREPIYAIYEDDDRSAFLDIFGKVIEDFNWVGQAHKDRDQAMLKAHDTGQYSYSEIGEHCKVHFTTVGGIVRFGRQAKKQADGKPKR